MTYISFLTFKVSSTSLGINKSINQPANLLRQSIKMEIKSSRIESNHVDKTNVNIEYQHLIGQRAPRNITGNLECHI